MSVSSIGRNGNHTRSHLGAGGSVSSATRHHQQQQQVLGGGVSRYHRHHHHRAGGQHHRITDYHTEHTDTEQNNRSSSPVRIGQRSQSLSTLQSTSAVIQPRMAQLETLEAKMASIEVSLSTATPRRKKTSLTSTTPTPRSNSRIVNITSPKPENLKSAVRDKENITRSIRGQKSNNNNDSSYNISGFRGLMTTLHGSRDKELLNDNECRHLEDRLLKLKSETENKRSTIKKLKLALEKLDITDNIDVRIQQAELEYQLGREELNLLTLLEEYRTVQVRLDESTAAAVTVKNQNNRNTRSTVYACVCEMGRMATLLAIDVRWTPDSPRFGAVVKENNRERSVWLEWAAEESGLRKGDRVVEINGKLLISRNTNREEILRLLSAAPEPAQLVVLRSALAPPSAGATSNNNNNNSFTSSSLSSNNTNEEVATLRSELGLIREHAEETQRAKNDLRADNLRLTHRILYLEEQVSELLESKRQQSYSNNHHQSYASNSHNNNKQELQEVVEQRQQIRVVTSTAVKSHQNITNINIGPTSDDVQVFQKGVQLTALLTDGCSSNNRFSPSLSVRTSRSSSCIAASEKYITDDEQWAESRRSTDIDEIYSSHRRTDARSVKSLDLDTTSSYSSNRSSSHHYAKPRKSLDYTSEPTVLIQPSRRRPTPPKKPIRLSIHRAQSLQSMDNSLVPSAMGMVSLNDAGSGTFGDRISSGGRKRTHKERLSSGLRWSQNGLATVGNLHQKQNIRWC